MNVVAVIGTVKGGFVLRSGPARKTWRIEGPIFKGWKVTAAARDPNGRYLVATASVVYGAAIHLGKDLKKWRQVEDGPRYPDGGDRKLTKIWRITVGSKAIYAGVDEAGLFRSADHGTSWEPMSGLNDHPTRAKWSPGAGGLCAHAVLEDPKNPDRLWCGISAVGVFRSDDGGRTWNSKNDGVPVVIPDKDFKEIGFCVHALVQDPDDAGTIFRQDHAGMFRTRDGGDSWERIEKGLPSRFGFPVVMDPATRALFAFPQESDEYRIACGGRFRVYRSRNGGKSWEPVTRGLPQAHVYAGVLRSAMAVDSLDPCGVYVGSTSGSFHWSADRGNTWKTLPASFPRILCVFAFHE